MAPTDMEDAITKLDRRLEGVEQILPTLATKTDLEQFAAKADLERLATKEELRAGLGAAKRHTSILFEDLRDDIRKVAEAVAGLSTLSAVVIANQKTLERVIQRLDTHEAMLRDLTKKRRD